jgi:hypothetical protein
MWKVLFGHLVGDYLLQSQKMAIKKSEKGLSGLSWCIFHCLIYTLSVCLVTWRADWQFVLIIFLSHFPIDRWSLGTKWLHLIGGRDIMAALKSTSPYREIEIGFACLVYAIVDNTMHLILLWIIFISGSI